MVFLKSELFYVVYVPSLSASFSSKNFSVFEASVLTRVPVCVQTTSIVLSSLEIDWYWIFDSASSWNLEKYK